MVVVLAESSSSRIWRYELQSFICVHVWRSLEMVLAALQRHTLVCSIASATCHLGWNMWVM